MLAQSYAINRLYNCEPDLFRRIKLDFVVHTLNYYLVSTLQMLRFSEIFIVEKSKNKKNLLCYPSKKKSILYSLKNFQDIDMEIHSIIFL